MNSCMSLFAVIVIVGQLRTSTSLACLFAVSCACYLIQDVLRLESVYVGSKCLDPVGA